MVQMSGDWENENSCWGYRKNEEASLSGFRIFVAETGGVIIGYLFGATQTSKGMSAVIPDDRAYFEIEELYMKPAYRSQGIGRALMNYLEDILLAEKIDHIFLSTAIKDYKRILHFYIEEMGMSFWSARLFREIKQRET